MRTRTKSYVAVALIAVACLGLYACGGDQNQSGGDINIFLPPTPTLPSVAPSPAPGTGGGSTAAFDNVGIFAFGYENDDDPSTPACAAPPDGQRQTQGGQYIVPVGCQLALTATAFDTSGNPVHLAPETAITWAASGAGRIEPRAPTAFNRTYKRSGVGAAFVSVTVGGKQGVRGFENR